MGCGGLAGGTPAADWAGETRPESVTNGRNDDVCAAPSSAAVGMDAEVCRGGLAAVPGVPILRLQSRVSHALLPVTARRHSGLHSLEESKTSEFPNFCKLSTTACLSPTPFGI